MNHLDLFSGIGGFSLAAQRVWGKEHNIIAFCENDKYCQKVLKKHWPDVPIIETIEELTYERILAYTNASMRFNVCGQKSKQKQTSYKGACIRSRTQGEQRTEAKAQTIELLTGGWPCQPFSIAGKRKGREDDRYLWHHMFRVIQETKPAWIIGENVTGIIDMELDNVLSNLESEGYETQPFNIPACGVDARHRRDRTWIVARNTNNTIKAENGAVQKGEDSKPTRICTDVSNTKKQGLEGFSRNDRERGVSDATKNGVCKRKKNVGNPKKFRNSGKRNNESGGEYQESQGESGRTRLRSRRKTSIWPVEPSICELVDGVSSGLVRYRGRVAKNIPNRVQKLKALGNAIVPQVVEVIMRGIKEIEANK